jgi:hypothetical protein
MTSSRAQRLSDGTWAVSIQLGELCMYATGQSLPDAKTNLHHQVQDLAREMRHLIDSASASRVPA